jgi:RNA polymerase sigma factor (sigma-70 family)
MGFVHQSENPQICRLLENELLHGCLKGDPRAQKALYDEYKTPLFRMCLRYSKDKMEAEDFLQEGFIRIFSDLPHFRAQGPLGAWLYRVMLNSILQQVRKKERKLAVLPLDPSPYLYPDHAADPFLGLDAQTVTGMIQQLPAGYRVVFNLFVIEGFSHQEIAELLRISESTSKSQLFKARAALRKLARVYYPELAEGGKI